MSFMSLLVVLKAKPRNPSQVVACKSEHFIISYDFEKYLLFTIMHFSCFKRAKLFLCANRGANQKLYPCSQPLIITLLSWKLECFSEKRNLVNSFQK